MGGPSKSMMKVAFAVIAFAAIAAAVPSEFTEEAPALDLVQLQDEVHSDIKEMQKKGATEADCKDLAETSCKEVRREVRVNQGLINKLTTGSECISRGQGDIKKMTLEWEHEKKIHQQMKIKVSETLKRRVKITSQRYSQLKPGRCGFIFSSRDYLAVHHAYRHAIKVELSYRGRVSEAWNAVVRARRTAKRMVHKCHCTAKRAENNLWRTVNSRKLVSKQNKAYAKCLMMTCVLNGTRLTSRSCKGTLPRLVRKRLHRDTQRASCSGSSRGPVRKMSGVKQPTRRL